MEWKIIEERKSARDYLPKDQQFLAVWKGTICIAEYDDEEDAFWISFNPSQFVSWRLPKDREIKFTHFLLFKMPDNFSTHEHLFPI